MDHVLVRYGEIGSKSRPVAGRMITMLRDRVAERLEHDGLPHERVETISGRVLVETDAAGRAARAAAELPGVASASPAIRAEPSIDAIGRATDRIEVGATFGVDATAAGDHPFTSRELNEEVGARIGERTGADVDLDDPETWVEIDVREGGAYVFTERFEGPNGFPVGSQAPVAALVSGGIDSPVAAYEAMTRGSPVVPVYFYNRPFAAGDHRVRFEAALAELRRFDPAGDWDYYLVDMGDANEALVDVEGGRMLLHRVVLLRVAERIAADEGLEGIVTGESMGQKSSQTTVNLSLTTSRVDLPVFRPLLATPKEEIVERARSIGTFEAAVVDSACRTIAPENPSPEMDADRFAALEERVGIDDLVDAAYDSAERVSP